MATLGDKLREAREESGRTQAEVAQSIGVSQPTLSRIEAGKGGTVQTLEALASAYGLTLQPKADPFPLLAWCACGWEGTAGDLSLDDGCPRCGERAAVEGHCVGSDTLQPSEEDPNV